jgi:hypothetical protein
MINRIVFLSLLVFSALGSVAQKGKKAVVPQQVAATGQDDRAVWVNSLYKIVYPVIHHLAEGTLKQEMPLETGPQYYLQVKKVTYLEAVGRTMAGVAPWLALPDDETTEGKMRKQLRNELLKGLRNAVDPAHPDYLNFRTEGQPIVDAAYVAHAFLRAPKALWEPLDAVTKQRFIEEFKSLRNRKGAYNNWLLFSALTEGFLLSIGEQHDPARIDFGIRKMKEWYAGDGWYSDGEKFSMDYYNSFVIHPMLVDLLQVLVQKKMAQQQEYDLALQRMVRHAEFLERIVSPEGTYPAFGRSITYRTAAFQVLAQVALMEKLPEHISQAQVRCALTSVIQKMFTGNHNFDSKGWLVLGFNGHQPAIADQYTSTGSLYLCSIGFLTLGLPATHAFWTDAATDWTSRKAWRGEPVKKDYKVEY